MMYNISTSKYTETNDGSYNTSSLSMISIFVLKTDIYIYYTS